MRADGRTHSPKEPARQKLYRRLYIHTKERLDNQDDLINFLIEETDRLRVRIEELEHARHKDCAA